MKTSLEEFKGRFEHAEWTSKMNQKFKGLLTLLIWREKKIEEKWTEPKESVEYYATDQTCVFGEFQEEKIQGKEAERICKEIMAVNFPNLMKYTNINMQEAQQILSKMNWKQQQTHYD